MDDTTTYGTWGQDADDRDLFALRPEEELASILESQVHLLKKGVICTTDYRAHKKSPFEIVLDGTEGFVPLWEQGQILRWRFDLASLSVFQQPDALMTKVRSLLFKAITAWGDAAPIRFTENADNSDFQIVLVKQPNCTPFGCTLARAFFPDAGRHQLYIYPTMFEQSEKEQVDTLAHEIGHVFGLRHYFAPEQETQWPSVIFGEHNPFSIMNYGNNSELTAADRRDLKLLYDGVWSGQIKEVNGTPVKQVRTFNNLLK